MKVDSIAWATFRIPLVADFVTAHGPLRVREGTIVRILAGGIQAFGEASPVPGFPGPSVGQTCVLLEQLGRELVGRDSGQAPACFSEVRGERAARIMAGCAMDIALHDLRAQELGLSVADLLGGDATRAIRVNATVAALDQEVAARSAQEAVAAGFSCVKLKVGVAGSLEDEVGRVGAVREAIGQAARLRLDANGAWDRHTAVARILALEAFGIELVEQPVAADDIRGLAEVRAAVHTPIAADEAVSSADQARRIILAEAADVLVIKPMAVGGLGVAVELIRLARAARLGAIVTTSIDTAIGTAAAVHLSTTLPDQQWACGLGTAGLLMSDLARVPIHISGGVAKIPPGTGLGVALDPENFAMYTDGWHGVGA